jgi:HSP20 family protein
MLSPNIDIAESKDAIDVTRRVASVDEKDVDVTLANGMLTVRGEKRQSATNKTRTRIGMWWSAAMGRSKQNNTSAVRS